MATELGPTSQTLVAPQKLIVETRTEFRAAALEYVERVAAEGGGSAVIDLKATAIIDAIGLGVLVYVRKHAADRGVKLVLANASPEARHLLELTRLAPHFDYL